MATTQLAIVAAERNVFAGEVDLVLAPSAVGQLGILPRHAPLLTLLVPGTLHIRQGDSERLLAVGGGFLEADQTHVTCPGELGGVGRGSGCRPRGGRWRPRATTPPRTRSGH